MQQNINRLLHEFYKIRDMGWVKGTSKGTSNVGRTLETLLTIPENNFEIPDYNGIEIKAKRGYSKSYITLFNCTPYTNTYHSVEMLKDKYGYPDKIMPMYRVLNNSVFGNIKTLIGNRYYFKLKVDNKNQRVVLVVYNKLGFVIDDSVYWDFDLLYDKLNKKVKFLALASALCKKIDNEEYFKYYRMVVYELKDFKTFIQLINDGVVRITFKISVFRDEMKKGQIHDHGTSFEIREEDMPLLFNYNNKRFQEEKVAQ